jgi:hypothetical protein
MNKGQGAMKDEVANWEILMIVLRKSSLPPVSKQGTLAEILLVLGEFRRFRAKLDKKFVDRQAASPSSWKTPFIATVMAW